MSADGQERADPPPWTGPWADDARRLFQLLQSVAEQAGASSGEGSWPGRESPGSSGSSGPSDCEHPPECRYCPVCQGISLLRRAGPDVLDQVSEFAAGLAATLRATPPPPGDAASEPSDDPSTEPADGPAGDRTSAPPRPPSTVRIDVTD